MLSSTRLVWVRVSHTQIEWAKQLVGGKQIKPKTSKTFYHLFWSSNFRCSPQNRTAPLSLPTQGGHLELVNSTESTTLWWNEIESKQTNPTMTTSGQLSPLQLNLVDPKPFVAVILLLLSLVRWRNNCYRLPTIICGCPKLSVFSHPNSDRPSRKWPLDSWPVDSFRFWPLTAH